MMMLKIASTIATILLLLETAAMAQDRSAARACAGDIKTLCAGVPPGEGRIRACIKGHFGDLSAPCQAVLLTTAAVGKACRDDVKKLCADVKPGHGKVLACIKTHLAELSDPCRDALAQASAGKT
jgi:hypothetical protein